MPGPSLNIPPGRSNNKLLLISNVFSIIIVPHHRLWSGSLRRYRISYNNSGIRPLHPLLSISRFLHIYLILSSTVVSTLAASKWALGYSTKKSEIYRKIWYIFYYRRLLENHLLGKHKKRERERDSRACMLVHLMNQSVGVLDCAMDGYL